MYRILHDLGDSADIFESGAVDVSPPVSVKAESLETNTTNKTSANFCSLLLGNQFFLQYLSTICTVYFGCYIVFCFPCLFLKSFHI